jgi:hypothetical protein
MIKNAAQLPQVVRRSFTEHFAKNALVYCEQEGVWVHR